MDPSQEASRAVTLSAEQILTKRLAKWAVGWCEVIFLQGEGMPTLPKEVLRLQSSLIDGSVVTQYQQLANDFYDNRLALLRQAAVSVYGQNVTKPAIACVGGYVQVLIREAVRLSADKTLPEAVVSGTAVLILAYALTAAHEEIVKIKRQPKNVWAHCAGASSAATVACLQQPGQDLNQIHFHD